MENRLYESGTGMPAEVDTVMRGRYSASVVGVQSSLVSASMWTNRRPDAASRCACASSHFRHTSLALDSRWHMVSSTKKRGGGGDDGDTPGGGGRHVVRGDGIAHTQPFSDGWLSSRRWNQ